MAFFSKVRFAVLTCLLVLGAPYAGLAHGVEPGPLRAGAAKVDITPRAS